MTMSLIKQKTKAFMSLLFLLLIFVVSMTMSHSAYAAPPKCYVLPADDSGEPVEAPACPSGDLVNLEDDTCYGGIGGGIGGRLLNVSVTLDCDTLETTGTVDTDGTPDPPPPPPPAGGSTGRFTCTGTACVEDNPITRFLVTLVNFLSALVGIIVIAVIIMAGIQYTTSGGNPQVAAQAKKRIINAVTALVAFFFLFAILQWLIPGGIFKS